MFYNTLKTCSLEHFIGKQWRWISVYRTWRVNHDLFIWKNDRLKARPLYDEYSRDYDSYLWFSIAGIFIELVCEGTKRSRMSKKNV